MISNRGHRVRISWACAHKAHREGGAHRMSVTVKEKGGGTAQRSTHTHTHEEQNTVHRNTHGHRALIHPAAPPPQHTRTQSTHTPCCTASAAAVVRLAVAHDVLWEGGEKPKRHPAKKCMRTKIQDRTLVSLCETVKLSRGLLLAICQTFSQIDVVSSSQAAHAAELSFSPHSQVARAATVLLLPGL